MSAYVSLTALKETIGLTGEADDSNDDGILQSVIVRASGKVDSFLAQNRIGYVGFAPQGSVGSNSREAVGSNTRTYDGDGSAELFIDDFASVASVTIDGTAIDAADYKVWPYNETPKRSLIFVTTEPPIIGRGSGTWTRGTANVAVTGFAGLNHVPSDVEQTTIAVAIIYWRRYQQGNPPPVVTPRGSRGYVVDDPEVEGILVSGLSGWINAGVWGG